MPEYVHEGMSSNRSNVFEILKWLFYIWDAKSLKYHALQMYRIYLIKRSHLEIRYYFLIDPFKVVYQI